MLIVHPLLKRPLRAGGPRELGEPTQELVVRAIEEGRLDEAKELARYMIPEGKSLHDLFCDWIWDIYSKVGAQQGDEAVYRLSRATQENWMMRRTWKAFSKLPVLEQVQLTCEIMRAHRCGPRQDGEVGVEENGERYTIIMDPCGSGGRMRRGDPVDGTPSRLGPPYSFGVTREAHWWCWGQKGVPYYCLHCAVNEILPMEWGGFPLWVTAYDPDHQAPCAWHFYKKPSLIPEIYFTRLGKTKPAGL
ncbi:MAG: hypothetical protein KJ720_04350 [Proteobacteria bacterium]|nr:hypothetical protein [Pseudomonadota bacterium]MBU1452086.1 hypothetical protein [Pseudomonadota bacterium]MBU2467283.1 hypothetical protein [Pseudomonadota bacterium]